MTYLKIATFLEVDDAWFDAFIGSSPAARCLMLVNIMKERPELISFAEPDAIRENVVAPIGVGA